ncbi:MAG: hypothetical protein RLZZ106_615 [Cyanobacteriota bacterium]|jgi:hypothetical protein
MPSAANPLQAWRRLRLLRATALISASAGAAATALLLGSGPAQAASETLYVLETTCSLRGGADQPCVVEAVNEDDVTLYRHRIGKSEEVIRISEQPVRMARWDATTKRWVALSSAGARFSTNTICYNGRDLCVVNANYLNSVREEKAEATAGRDLVRVKFDADGRINLTCYDEACEGVQ